MGEIFGIGNNQQTLYLLIPYVKGSYFMLNLLFIFPPIAVSFSGGCVKRLCQWLLNWSISTLVLLVVICPGRQGALVSVLK